jgi:hypothetical protein
MKTATVQTMMKTTTKQVRSLAWFRIEEYSYQHAPPPSPNLQKPYVAKVLPRLTSKQSETLSIPKQHPRNTLGDNNREITHTSVPMRIDHNHAWHPATENNKIAEAGETAGEDWACSKLYSSTVTGGKMLEKKNPSQRDTTSANTGVRLGIQVHLPTLGFEFFIFPWS